MRCFLEWVERLSSDLRAHFLFIVVVLIRPLRVKFCTRQNYTSAERTWQQMYITAEELAYLEASEGNRSFVLFVFSSLFQCHLSKTVSGQTSPLYCRYLKDGSCLIFFSPWRTAEILRLQPSCSFFSHCSIYLDSIFITHSTALLTACWCRPGLSELLNKVSKTVTSEYFRKCWFGSSIQQWSV